MVLRSYVVVTKGLEDVNAVSIRPHGGLDRRVLAVALHEDVGGAVDVEARDHAEHRDKNHWIAKTLHSIKRQETWVLKFTRHSIS